ncbi:MAG TPA: cold shock domain-containing protein [Nitrososphaera sp.]|nr:cold shock domain-containing protein [Nitrososphaera sp.]
MSVGRVKFFQPEKFWGVITTSDLRDLFFHGSECQQGEPVRNQWVTFIESTKYGKPRAISVVPIDCPLEFQCRGIVARFDSDRNFGFIKHEKGEIFFHINDVLLAVDGVEYFPVKGCVVDFYVGQKSNKDQAVNVAIVEWPPEYKQTIEEYFSSAEPEPESEPQPELEPGVEPQSELLKPENRTKTILELIRQHKK